MVLPSDQLATLLQLLTWLAILDNKQSNYEVPPVSSKSIGLLQQSAVAILSTLTKVKCYASLMIRHCVLPLIRLSGGASEIEIESSSSTVEESAASSMCLLHGLTSVMSLPLVWQLIGRLCRSSLENGDNVAVAGAVNSTGISHESFRKRSRSELDGEDVTASTKTNHQSSVAGICLLHLLVAATQSDSSEGSSDSQSYVASVDSHVNNVSSATIDALLHLLPIEPGSSSSCMNSYATVVVI